MKGAYKNLIKETSFTIEDILNNKWLKMEPKLRKLSNLLTDKEIDNIYKSFMQILINHSKVLGKEFTLEQIENISKIEKLISTSIKSFNNKNIFHHEKFNEGKIKKCKNVSILPKLYRYEYLEQFVDSMKLTKEDNFISLALIDRTFKEITNKEYDENYDSFFAYGFKNNNIVYVISDRVIYDSPETIFKTRNPGRAFRDKVNYSWLPYYKINTIKNSSNSNLLLTYNNTSNIGTNIVDLFDDEGILYSTLIMTLIYQKYFINAEDETERLYFSSEIKLLPETSSKAIIKANGLLLPTLPNNIKAQTYKYEHLDENYSNSLYDYLIDMYPLENNSLPRLSNFIGTKDKAEQFIWWKIRKEQAQHIQKCLTDDYNKYYNNLNKWLGDNITKNLKDIVNYILKQKIEMGIMIIMDQIIKNFGKLIEIMII